VLYDPGNLTLKQVVRYAWGVKRKGSLFLYDDQDPDNLRGPVNSGIFTECWQYQGSPTDFFELHEVTRASTKGPQKAATNYGYIAYGSVEEDKPGIEPLETFKEVVFINGEGASNGYYREAA
jgi:hypothetical protein